MPPNQKLNETSNVICKTYLRDFVFEAHLKKKSS